MEDDYSSSFLVYMCVITLLGTVAFLRLFMPEVQLTHRLIIYAILLLLLERICCMYLAGLSGVLIFTAVCFLAFQSLSSPKLSVQGKAVLITGCDSGFGKTMAQHFDSLGFEVFATVLNKNGPGAKELSQMCSEQLTLIQMDLTKPEDIEQALQITKEKLGEKGLWGLVNNAGMCFNINDAELSAMSNYRCCMEVNFFGTIAITKGFLPLIRRAKGRIVNVSSPVGEIPLPFLAPYGASKAALTLFTNILRLELRHWGVKVCTILPAFYKTAPSCNFEYWEQQVHHLIKSISSELLQDYGEEYMLETKDLFLKYIATAREDFSPVIESITDAILSRNPKPRYYAGKAVIVLYIFLCILPTSLSDLIFNRFFLIKKVLPKALKK
ncbi:11-beta-hydroxysteroid dehydrogenase type 2-like isoform X1 [Rhincodon typus]|uniref:11-beta-hydroxysteroid dehydrogenase type 2-like isoform X1 n=1 Tax=Rhincodon typus TaxID=259920 RepID=UPI0009A46A02|nr:11-beta-hydroxysteroid dehydrogenase type 2-like isoform X1 [Rhincodon typus]